MTTASQNRIIHSLLPRIPHFSDADYRDLLVDVTGKSSSKYLDQAEADKVIKALKLRAGQSAPGVRRVGRTAEGPYAKKLQALWIALYNLGAVDNRDDAALIGFVKRQTGMDHTRWLTEPADAKKAVEALKDMAKRECARYGVELPAKDASKDFIETKQLICMAVAARAVECGAFTLFSTFRQDWPSLFERYAFSRGGFPASSPFYTPAHWDKLAAMLATKTRMHLKNRRAA